MKPTHIIIHHSLTKDSLTVSWGAIRKYHIFTNGWEKIGYHCGLELIDDAYEILIGRMWDETGAHCKEQGMNRKSLGVCFVGNFDLIEPPLAQWKKGVEFVAMLCRIFVIPVENIKAHRDYATYKSCPGKLFDMDKFRTDVQNY